jgi:DNA-binding XRE family transcriptional regulator
MAKCECCGQEIKGDRPGDLITQAEAAVLIGVTTQAIYRATRDGRLTTWEVDTPNPRKGKHQVSKSEVLQKFTKA